MNEENQKLSPGLGDSFLLLGLPYLAKRSMEQSGKLNFREITNNYFFSTGMSRIASYILSGYI